VARILLAASASVAVYKACDLASKLVQSGHSVRAILTPKAARLISPQLFEAVTGEHAYSDEFDASRRSSMDHIELARWGEGLVVAPCSADLAARLALGLGDDLVTTVALAFASDRPRLVCPAMNPTMLASAPLRRNLEVLRGDGWEILDPDAGHMACGDEGAGRLPDPARIADWIASRLSR
jgi:phosphopantothenoylcysteine synthetase/decarboxylase